MFLFTAMDIVLAKNLCPPAFLILALFELGLFKSQLVNVSLEN